MSVPLSRSVFVLTRRCRSTKRATHASPRTPTARISRGGRVSASRRRRRRGAHRMLVETMLLGRTRRRRRRRRRCRAGRAGSRRMCEFFVRSGPGESRLYIWARGCVCFFFFSDFTVLYDIQDTRNAYFYLSGEHYFFDGLHRGLQADNWSVGQDSIPKEAYVYGIRIIGRCMYI